MLLTFKYKIKKRVSYIGYWDSHFWNLSRFSVESPQHTVTTITQQLCFKGFFKAPSSLDTSDRVIRYWITDW